MLGEFISRKKTFYLMEATLSKIYFGQM